MSVYVCMCVCVSVCVCLCECECVCVCVCVCAPSCQSVLRLTAVVSGLRAGLKTAMVEADDFSSGTSSRSTKLIHGGVRYLEKAFKNFDYGQYKLVKEALHERANLLKIAPHLASALPIMIPVYKCVSRRRVGVSM